jgi:hypothetical protein
MMCVHTHVRELHRAFTHDQHRNPFIAPNIHADDMLSSCVLQAINDLTSKRKACALSCALPLL